jgi:uncharacterized membrane protein YjjP (DUF1212 family)
MFHEIYMDITIMLKNRNFWLLFVATACTALAWLFVDTKEDFVLAIFLIVFAASYDFYRHRKPKQQP